MLAILILSVCFSFLVTDALINDFVVAGQPALLPPSTLPLSVLNYNLENKGTSNKAPLVPLQAAATAQKAIDCPNTAILLNILNILTNSLPRDAKATLEPEKFKYVLMVVKKFIETTPLNPGTVELYNKFKILEAQVTTIYGIENQSLRELDERLRSKILSQYNVPAQSNSNCQDIFNYLIKFINTAYSQVLRYCLTNEKCTINNVNTNFDNGLDQFHPIVQTQRNFTTNTWPVHETLPKESITAGAGLINLPNIKSEEGKGVPNIMSILQNYRPSGFTNTPESDLKSPTGIQTPSLHVNPRLIQMPSSYPPNGQYPNVQPSNINNLPNINSASWQTIFSKVKGLPGDTSENQQYVKFLAQKFYEGNNLVTQNSIYPGIENPTYLVNGQIVPIKTVIPNADPKETVKTNPSVNKNPNLLFELVQRPSNQQQNLLNTNIKIMQTDMTNPIINVPTTQKNLQNLQNLNIQSLMPQNFLYEKPTLPQQNSYFTYYLNQYPENQPGLVAKQILNRNSVGYNQIFPFHSYYNEKYNSGQNMLTDNTKHGNYGGQLLDLNKLLGVANLGKLNTLPQKNGVVELTYFLKRPKPVYEPKYYVTYRLPYQTFLYNLQNLLVKKTNLRNEPSQLHQDLLVGSNVTDSSNDLKGLNYEDILKLTSTNGTLVNAKILENNDTIVDQTLKIVQTLNSKLPVENIININATKNIPLETQKNMNANKNSSNVSNNNFVNNINPGLRRNVFPNYPYNTLGRNPSRLQANPYSVYQTKPVGYLGMPFLKYGAALPTTNVLKNPALNLPYITNSQQFG